MPVRARPAATVILLRDGAPGLEVLLLKRHARTLFGPGASVFPGGAVDAVDAGPDQPPCNLDDATASAELGLTTAGLAYRMAAIRECFEEAGILLAQHTDGTLISMDQPDMLRRFEQRREALRHQRLSLAELCRHEDLQVYGSRLHYVSHWITPAYSPKRFDTRFFLAVVPPRQEATCCGRETVDQYWTTPEAGLEAHRSGELDLMTPTSDTLERLRRYASTDAVIAELARGKERQGSAIPGHGLMEQRFPDPA